MGKFTQKGIDSMEKKKVKIRVNSTRPESETVGQWMDLWLENYVRPSIRQSTYEVYRAYLDNHLIPKLGEVPLDELSASDIQFFLRDLQYHGNKKSPEKGVDKMHFVLSAIYSIKKVTDPLASHFVLSCLVEIKTIGIFYRFVLRYLCIQHLQVVPRCQTLVG